MNTLNEEAVLLLLNVKQGKNQFTKALASPGMKICCRCENEKPLSEYTKNRAKPDGLDARCKECKREIRQANREYNAEKSREWREANPNRFKERRDAWSDKNRLQENARLRITSAKRRRVMKDTIVEEVDYNRILERDNYICHICGKYVQPGDVQFDHVVPLVRGGTHTYDNIKVPHSLCNQRKGTKLMNELEVTATIKSG